MPPNGACEGLSAVRVTFLGTATSSGLPVIGCRCRVCTSADPRNTRYRASALIEWDGRSVVVDTGPEFRLQVLRQKLDHLDAVLLTHEHADHIYGLDDVRFFTARGGEMPLFAEPRTLEAVRGAFPYIFNGRQTPGTFRPTIAPVPVNGPFELFGRTFEPVRVMHGDLPITAFRTGPFAYATDVSRIPSSSMGALRGLDTLVLGALRHRPHPTHFTLDEALEAIAELKPRRAFLTHIGHNLDHEETSRLLPPHVELAYDGLAVET